MSSRFNPRMPKSFRYDVCDDRLTSRQYEYGSNACEDTYQPRNEHTRKHKSTPTIPRNMEFIYQSIQVIRPRERMIGLQRTLQMMYIKGRESTKSILAVIVAISGFIR
ncbi:unnamed protein product [Heterobilharzia americana]|nr:unnamed protein product [Heterobilharzia americana]